MIKLLYYTLILALSGLPGAVNAAQTCKSDSEIPASTPTSRFRDHGNGAVTDTQTGLMWAKCAEGYSGSACSWDSTRTDSKHKWKEALDLANSSTLAGYKDWRLPNIKELRSIVERQCSNPAINLLVFPNTSSSASKDPGFWSSSPAHDSKYAWHVLFYYGNSYSNGRMNIRYVRLVRSGQ